MTGLGDCVNFCGCPESTSKVAVTSFLISEEKFWPVDGQFWAGKTERIELAGTVGEHTMHEVICQT